MKREILSEIEEEIIKIFNNGILQHTLILVLFEGEHLPECCVHMPRDPEAEDEMILTNNLAEIVLSKIRINRSIEDGALMIRIDCDAPIIKGFSYRLYPPPLNIPRRKNMGSGYNSALDFSGLDKIKYVYFINKDGVTKFIKGYEMRLC
jgi:hypothetical protein